MVLAAVGWWAFSYFFPSTFEFTAVDADGAPVEGLDVTWVAVGDRLGSAPESKPGAYRVDKDTVCVELCGAGIADALVVRTEQQSQVVLEPAGEVLCRVVDFSGRPLEGVPVVLIAEFHAERRRGSAPLVLRQRRLWPRLYGGEDFSHKIRGVFALHHRGEALSWPEVFQLDGPEEPFVTERALNSEAPGLWLPARREQTCGVTDSSGWVRFDEVPASWMGRAVVAEFRSSAGSHPWVGDFDQPNTDGAPPEFSKPIDLGAGRNEVSLVAHRSGAIEFVSGPQDDPTSCGYELLRVPAPGVHGQTGPMAGSDDYSHKELVRVEGIPPGTYRAALIGWSHDSDVQNSSHAIAQLQAEPVEVEPSQWTRVEFDADAVPKTKLEFSWQLPDGKELRQDEVSLNFRLNVYDSAGDWLYRVRMDGGDEYFEILGFESESVRFDLVPIGSGAGYGSEWMVAPGAHSVEVDAGESGVLVVPLVLAQDE